MVQEFVNKEMIVLIPKSDAEKIENGELSLYPPQLRKKGKIIRHVDTLDSNDNFYAKNPVIQISNQYIFAESLYSKKLKAKITEVSNQIKKNEKLIEKLIQLQFNDIEAKVIKFNNHLQQNLDNNPLFTNKDVVYVGMDTIPTLTSNFSYLLEDFINSNQITYIQGQKYYYMSILEYNNLKDRRPNIQEIVIHNFSDHIIHFITLSLLNTLNDINLTNFKETGKFLHNWHSDLFNIKEKLIDTVNFLIVGILNYGDIYDICFHKHNNKIDMC